MKLIKKTVSVLALLFVVFAMTGCAELLGKIAGKIEEETPDPVTPSIDYEDEYSFIVHYEKTQNLNVTAKAEDKGVLSFQWYKGTTDKREDATQIVGTTELEKANAKSPIYLFTASDKEETLYFWCKVTNTNLATGKKAENWSDRYKVTVSNIIRLNGEHISSNTVWLPIYTYYITSWLSVDKTLEIPAGTVVKFGKDAYMETNGNGVIAVTGSEEKPVIFTSYLDNVGITIPEFEGSATKAAKGDWKGIEINGAQNSTFLNAEFRYANVAALRLRETTNVSKCLFINNKSDDDFSGALTIEENANESIVLNNVFYNNDWPLFVSANYSVDDSNVFHKPKDKPEDPDVINKYQAIVMDGGKHIKKSTVVDWKVKELPYVLKDSWVNVDTGATLNIGDASKNVIVKFYKDCYLEVDEGGTFTLGAGSILTSWKDDTHGGDIEANGQPAAPADGDWDGIYMNGSWKNDINTDTTRVLYNNKENYQD